MQSPKADMLIEYLIRWLMEGGREGGREGCACRNVSEQMRKQVKIVKVTTYLRKE